MSELTTNNSKDDAASISISAERAQETEANILADHSRNSKVLGFFLLAYFIDKPIMTLPIVGELNIYNSTPATFAAGIAIGFGLIFTFIRWNWFAEFSAWGYYGIVGRTVYENWDFGTGLEKISYGMLSSAKISWWLAVPIVAFLLIDCSKSMAKLFMHLQKPIW
ncbi:hypothetical protein FHR70_003705 [Microvirga lupini]|uniref:Uncharacterized protein n=1 Tax=Microvirga lupini TaxID=420324 RepID=A0A7W4VNU3_9HYPH|nr:hypothetical protein [Microvirga lupini]MBB3020619.1 hypothetical protein [Microvirga lupini]